MASNLSKPYQAQIIREVGFGIAETCITNDPEAARLHDALDAAHFEKERAENVSTVMNGQLSRLYERVRTFEDASVAAHLTGSTVKAACDATAVVADDEVDTPAAEQARSLAQIAERVWIGLNDMLGEINDRTRS